MKSYSKTYQARRSHRTLWTVVVVAVVAAMAGAGAVFALRGSSTPATGQESSTTAAGARGASTTTTAPAGLAVVATSPASGATNVASNATLTVQFSKPVSLGSSLPTLDPPVSGTWQKQDATTLAFAASAPFVPSTTETLTVPAGMQGTKGASLATPTTVSFTVASGSTLRLQQLLATLNYLPVSFTATGQAAPNQMAEPQQGTFAWRWPNQPAELQSLWIEGGESVIVKGAVMTFQDQHKLTVDGLPGKQFWTALLQDVAANKVDPAPYTYAYVSKTVPQTLNVYNNGTVQLANIAVNTGAPGADTADGTFPVFEHVKSSRMQGTNPDGSTYDDPDVPWASYFNGGDALHGFVRSQYGFPQSNGCVEMPIDIAAQVWPLTPIGTLVTVVGPSV